eukprot:CAMPEP_0119108958 /NCGR_PEP_ID=MMETSP1180-20130426/16445_1 /TAXON_ID=3052 ORGANISM="Chlamydomonas cf sp, Strain CCMP681" /NCGR_SAMPLE_ID=MMETSP1180 /ASSEMBLY_ACC=CAM_ASM_000741 /LENGTH=189 /DNA_ID=CAMNT_0007094645 /DNA_START=53 /DNA_END=622 /DNA_ORIENTATION=+
MALSSLASAAPMLASILRASGGSASLWCSQTVRLMSGKSGPPGPTVVKEKELPQPSYSYASPGSSIMDPTYATTGSLGGAASNAKPLHTPIAKAKPAAAAQKEGEESSIAMEIQKRSLRKSSLSEPSYAEPSYVYGSPGSSLKEASYGYSTKDPVYVVDPAPKKPRDAPKRTPESIVDKSGKETGRGKK